MGRSGYTCVRHIFLWLNLIIWLSGCLLVAGGVWLRIQKPGQTTLVPHINGAGSDSLLIALGSICFIIAFLGCCGAWVQSKCMLVTYFSLVVVLFCGEFLIASLGYVFRDTISLHAQEQLEVGIQHHYNVTDNSLVPFWDHVQTELKCCGVRDYRNWYSIDAWPEEKRVPNSCCTYTARSNLDCGRTSNPNDWWPDGCLPKIAVWFTERLHYAIIIAFVVAFFQLFGLISSMVLFCSVRHKRGRTYQPSMGS